MPTYEYVCKSCGHLFEIVQSMRDDTLTECPECGGELRKVFAPPAISFKGSGFYATDQRKKAGKPPGEKGEKGEKKSGGEGGSDAGSGDGGGSDGNKKVASSEAPAADSKKESASSSNGPSSGASQGSKERGDP